MATYSEQLEKVRASIALYEASLDYFAQNMGVEEYWMDNGQNRTKVRRADIRAQRDYLDDLYRREAWLVNKCEGTMTVVRMYP